MTEEEFEFLQTPQAKQLVEEHINDDPAVFALRCKDRGIPVPALANQIKYLQRCRVKLPDYYASRCIIPPVSYEQSSSQFSTLSKEYTGNTCLDLTCGLGVDSFHFSSHFTQVVSLERDELLSKIARYNFGLLNAQNITVQNISAEDYLAAYKGEPFDLIYVDPSRRRDENKQRVFLLEDCSPDVLQLLPLLLKHGKQVLIKLSPLFDVNEAVKLFAPYLTSIEIVSVRNECKELLLLIENKETENPALICSLVDSQGTLKQYKSPFFQEQTVEVASEQSPNNFTFVYEPDVAFYKARKVTDLFACYFAGKGCLSASEGFYFANEELPDFPGRVFTVEEQFDYQPKQLKLHFKQKGIKQLNVVKRNFPVSAQEIRKAIGVNEGGEYFLLCTTLPLKKQACFLCKRV